MKEERREEGKGKVRRKWFVDVVVVVLLPGNADRVIEAQMTSDVQNFGHCATSADDAECSEHYVPANERSTKFVARPVGHPLLAGEYDQHVNAHIVKTGRPVAVEPNFGVRVLELVFKLENVRIVGHRHKRIHG